MLASKSVFAKEQQGKSNERSQAQIFWLRFYECFGIRAESATIYEQSVKKLSGAQGFFDSFIPGKLIVEHKNAGKDLDAAFDQAGKYFLALKEEERPRYIITSDFTRIRLYDLQVGSGYHQCKLAELPKKADWFMFLVEEPLTDITEESEADRSAAYAISKLHEATFAREFLPNEANCPNFVNADLIAAGLSPFAPDLAAFKAGRIMLETIADYARRGESFAFETTLSGLTYAQMIPSWQASGYAVKLIFLSLPNADMAVQRVAARVAQGGHNIPEDTVRRRFVSGIDNFSRYKLLVNDWQLYDNPAAPAILLDTGEQS